MQDFTKLLVWQKAHQLTLNIYKSTIDYPKEELYGLTSQTRRAAASIPTNIAEGCGRGGNAELGRFLQIAMGSAAELQYQLLLARDLSFMDGTVHDDLSGALTEVKRMLTGFMQSVRKGAN